VFGFGFDESVWLSYRSEEIVSGASREKKKKRRTEEGKKRWGWGLRYVVLRLSRRIMRIHYLRGLRTGVLNEESFLLRWV